MMNLIRLARDAMGTRAASIFVAALIAILAAAVSGCSPVQQTAAAVDPARARETLRTALESWKKGDAPDALKSASPAIVVQDLDWMAGQRLVNYEVVNDGANDNANLRIPVKLTLRTASGAETNKNVTYVVGTNPALTVFRDLP